MATWVFVFLPGKLNSWGFIAHLPLVERGVRIARTTIGDHILIEFNMKTFENLMLEQMRDRIKTITDVPKNVVNLMESNLRKRLYSYSFAYFQVNREHDLIGK